MGSFFAGIKAGTLGGLFYFGGIAVFNVILLYAFKTEAMSLISQSYSQSCPPVPTVNSSSIEDCFSSVAALYLPYVAFLGFFVSLIVVGLFGRFYESIPGGGPTARGEVAALLVGLILVSLGLTGVYLGTLATDVLAGFLVIWTGVYGFILGRLYRRYTRMVRFESTDERTLKVMVDGKDYTGRSRTFAHTSTHKAKAEASGGSVFKEWNVSGGVTVEDPRSFETLMEVSGDGLLKAQGGKKS